MEDLNRKKGQRKEELAPFYASCLPAWVSLLVLFLWRTLSSYLLCAPHSPPTTPLHPSEQHKCVSVNRSVVPNSLRSHGLQPTRLLCPWDFPGKDTGVGCHFLLQGIFPTQGSNLGLLPCRQILYWLSYKGSRVHGILQARILEWVAFPFSRGSSQPRDQTWVSSTAGRFFTNWATREAHTVEVTNRSKGLGLIDKVHEGLWMEVHDIVQEAVIKTIPTKKKCKRKNGCLSRPYK